MVRKRPKTQRSDRVRNFLRQFSLLVFAKNLFARLASNVWSVISPNKRRALFRKKLFDATKADALVVLTSRDETFVVSSSDMDIGKYTYVGRNRTISIG